MALFLGATNKGYFLIFFRFLQKSEKKKNRPCLSPPSLFFKATFFFCKNRKKIKKKSKKTEKKQKKKQKKNRKKWLFRRGFIDQRVAGVLSQRKRTRTRKRKKKEKKKEKKKKKKKKRKRKNDKPDILFVTPLGIDKEKRRRKKEKRRRKQTMNFC